MESELQKRWATLNLEDPDWDLVSLSHIAVRVVFFKIKVEKGAAHKKTSKTNQ